MSIDLYGQNGAAAAVSEVAPVVSATAQLVEWAQGAQAAYQVAENLVNTSFCPKHYQGKPHEATAAILAGLEVGLSPMAALQAFHNIQGTAAPKAITLRAIVQSRGHTLDLVESSATRAVVVGRRNGTGPPQTSTWTIERAQQAGLPGKNPNWKSQPEAMLIARATSEGARLTAGDAILGIPYSFEELEDSGPPVQAQAVQAAPERPVGRRRNPSSMLPAAASAAEPKREPSSDVPAELPPGAGRVDPNGQLLRELRELLGEVGVTDLGEVVRVVSDLAGREVAAPKDLTHREAGVVVDRLRAVRDAKRAEQAASDAGGEGT